MFLLLIYIEEMSVTQIVRVPLAQFIQC